MSGTTETPLNFAAWIEAIAGMAGLKLEKLSQTLVAIRCHLNENRTQVVWVSPLGRDQFGNTIIGVSSSASKLGTRGRHLSQKMANSLLRQNATLAHGAWAIQNIEGDDYLVMMDTQIAETMDTPEFAASVKTTAALADEMEQQLGQDNF